MKQCVKSGKHPESQCWPRRPEFMPPFRTGVDPNSPKRCQGLLFKIDNKLATTLDENTAVELNKKRPRNGSILLKNILKDKFWKHKEIHFILENTDQYKKHENQIKEATM